MKIPPQYKKLEGYDIDLIDFRKYNPYCKLHDVKLQRDDNKDKDYKKCTVLNCLAGCEELHGKIILFVAEYKEYLEHIFVDENNPCTIPNCLICKYEKDKGDLNA